MRLEQIEDAFGARAEKTDIHSSGGGVDASMCCMESAPHTAQPRCELRACALSLCGRRTGRTRRAPVNGRRAARAAQRAGAVKRRRACGSPPPLPGRGPRRAACARSPRTGDPGRSEARPRRGRVLAGMSFGESSRWRPPEAARFPRSPRRETHPAKVHSFEGRLERSMAGASARTCACAASGSSGPGSSSTASSSSSRRFAVRTVGAGRSGASPGRARGADVCALPSAAYAASSVSSPTSIGFRSGSLLHSNQPPSYTATFSQPMRSA